MADAPDSQPRVTSGGPNLRGRGLFRMALIDARPLMREGMTRWLKAIRRCQISCFSSVADFLEASASASPSAVVLSTGPDGLVDRNLLAKVDELTSKVPEIPVIVLSDHNGDAALDVVRRGVRAYIPTALEMPVARAALDLVMVGGYFIPATVLIDRSATKEKHQPSRGPDEMMQANSHPLVSEHSSRVLPNHGFNGKRTDALTSREAEVLACIQQGKPNKVIAFELNIRESTVKVHVGHLMRKLHAANRTQLAVSLSSAPLGGD